VLAERAHYGDDHAALCSPLIGNGVAANFVERLFYLSVAENANETSAQNLAHFAWRSMLKNGRRMQRNGSALEAEDDNIMELTSLAQNFIERKLPVWQRLNLI